MKKYKKPRYEYSREDYQWENFKERMALVGLTGVCIGLYFLLKYVDAQVLYLKFKLLLQLSKFL